MPDELAKPLGSQTACGIEGELRRLRPRGFRQLLEVLMLWTLVRSVVELAARLVLGYRRRCRVELVGSVLHLREKSRLLGSERSRRESLLMLKHLASVTVVHPRSRLQLPAGLFALAAGSYLGGLLFLEGLRAPGLAASLLGYGLALGMSGLFVDLGLSRLAARRSTEVDCIVQIRPCSGPGWELLGASRADTNALTAAIERALVSLGVE